MVCRLGAFTLAVLLRPLGKVCSIVCFSQLKRSLPVGGRCVETEDSPRWEALSFPWDTSLLVCKGIRRGCMGFAPSCHPGSGPVPATDFSSDFQINVTHSGTA